MRMRRTFQNFTCGACSNTLRSSPASKYSCGVKPNVEANSAAGNCWMPVLYSCTALLKKRREAAILFSRSVSSACSSWKLVLALRFGSLGGHRGVARLDHRLERAALVAGVALDRLDQVGNEVVALLELHVDVGAGLAHALA